MKPQAIVTVPLLLFVAVSVVYLVAKETGGRPTQNATLPGVASPQTAQEQDTRSPASAESTTATAKVRAYYFHGNVRCMTCRTIEAYAKEAVESGFADAVMRGRLEWRVINVDDPGNEHFIQDFQLSTASLVLELTEDGKCREWKNLQRVWELVRGDKEDLLKYIQDETRAYLEAAAR